MPGRLAAKRIMITGAAQGIGLAIAEADGSDRSTRRERSSGPAIARRVHQGSLF